MKTKVFSVQSLKVAGQQIVNGICASLIQLPSYFLIRTNHIMAGAILGVLLIYPQLNLLGWFGRVFWKWK